MPEIRVPNSVSIHAVRNFIDQNPAFFSDETHDNATLRLHPEWMHIEPYGLVMIAAWGRWCRRQGYDIDVQNLGPKADYAWRMHVFDHLDVDYTPDRQEREEAGRFVPVTHVRTVTDLRGVLGDISALLHLQESPETLAAVQYCISELLRNAIEHSASEGGAFVCAHNFDEADPPRVTVAVADCGVGIREHLGRAHVEAAESDAAAIRLALQPGITGAVAGMYGPPDNAGAGLFITRSIAKGSGGYFLVISGHSAYRLRRARDQVEQTELPLDPTADRHDMWTFGHGWNGTVVTLEIRTDMIADFDSYFAWIRQMVPEREEVTERIQFT